MTAPRIISLVFLLFLAVVGELCAQDTLVVPGARVRVYSPDRLTGTIKTLSPDTLVLRLEDRDSQAIPFASITRLEVSRGRKSNVGKGALFGFAIGAVGGAIVGAIAESGGCSFDGPDPCPLGGAAVGSFLGLPGAVLGALAGVVIKTDRWETVPLDQIRVSLTPRRGGLEVSAKFVY